MTKHLLDVEFDYDFQLIAICASVKDYKMAWALNRALNLNMERDTSDFEVNIGKNLSKHAIFRFHCTDSHVAYELIANKGTGGLLIPEQKQVQYFLLLYDNILVTLSDLCGMVRQISFVHLSFELDIEQLNNKENLITA